MGEDGIGILEFVGKHDAAIVNTVAIRVLDDDDFPGVLRRIVAREVRVERQVGSDEGETARYFRLDSVVAVIDGTEQLGHPLALAVSGPNIDRIRRARV